MEDLHALNSETTQAFLNRIYPYNFEELPEYDSEALAHSIDASRCRPVGTVALASASPYDSHKFPATESVAESTQEMEIPVLPETTAVLVKTVRLSADPRVVPLGEDPSLYPMDVSRRRFFLATVLD